MIKLFESLFSLFKIDFYPEKYLTIFEDIYDTDVISNIPLLQDIIFKEEQKRNVGENDNKQASHTLMQVNHVLVQKLALHKIVHLAANSQEINKKALESIKFELNIVFSQLGESTGDEYIERQISINLPGGLPPIETKEFIIPKTGSFSSRLYMLLKLTIAVISQDTAHL